MTFVIGKRMKIALLLCDDISAELQDKFGHYQDMFHHLVNKEDQLDVFPVYLYQENQTGFFPVIADYDGFIVSGSKHGVYEDHPWLAPLFAKIQQIFESGKKLVGVCFGHQAISMALGGKVAKSDKGWGIGHYQTTWMAENKPLSLLSFHQDQVAQMPKGFDVLAGSEFCPYYVTHHQQQVLTTQGHPEMSQDYILAIVDLFEDKIGVDTALKCRQSLQSHDDTLAFRQLICHFWTV